MLAGKVFSDGGPDFFGSGDCPSKHLASLKLSDPNGATRSPWPENAVASASFARTNIATG